MNKNFVFRNLGSLVQIFPLNRQAEKWIDNNLDLEPYQYFGNSVCVEPRYFDDIYKGIKEEYGE